jgi:hypothetical protein
VADFTALFPVEIISRMLGVPEDMRQQVLHWVDVSLYREPGEMEPTLDDREKISPAVEEILRYQPPSPAESCFALSLLRSAQGPLVVPRTGLPGGMQRGVAGLVHGGHDDGVVVDHHGDLAPFGQLPQQSQLDLGCGTAIAARAHHQPVLAQAVALEPASSGAPQPLGAAGQEYHLVVTGQMADNGQTFVVWRIVPGQGEERIPVLGTLFDVMKPVADVGDDTVEVHHGQRPLRGHQPRFLPSWPRHLGRRSATHRTATDYA